MVSCEGFGNGGVQAVIMTIVRALHHEYTFDALLFTEEERFYDKEFLSYGGKIFRIPNYIGNNKLRQKLDFFIRGIIIYKKLRTILKTNNDYAAIHCHNQADAAACLLAAKKAKIPVRISHAHIISTASRRRLKRFFNSFSTKAVAKHATHYIGCSEDACRTFFSSDCKWKCVNNPYDETRFDPSKFSICKPEKLSLIQIGSYSDNKNQLFSVEVLKEILAQGVDAQLNFIGFGDFLEVIQRKVKELGVESHVVFHPGGANAPAILADSSYLLFPSKKEGFGIVLIEAQAMGVKCYSSDTVPQTTDCGGVCYLPLDLGPRAWAEEIVKDFNSNTSSRTPYDCSKFSTKATTDVYKEIYGG